MELIKRIILSLKLAVYEARFYLRTGLTTSRLKRLWSALFEYSETSNQLWGSVQQVVTDWKPITAGKYKLLVCQGNIVTEDGLLIFIKAAYHDASNLMIYVTTEKTDWQLVLNPRDWEHCFIDGEWRKIIKALCKEML